MDIPGHLGKGWQRKTLLTEGTLSSGHEFTSKAGPGEEEGVTRALGTKRAAVGRESLNSLLLSTKNSKVLLPWRWLLGWQGWLLAKAGVGAPV